MDQTTKYSNIYKYKTAPGEPALYSKPYRFDANQNKFDMDKNSTIDLTTEYVEHSTMDASDFNLYKATYGYKWVFNSTQIGKQNSGVINMNRLYYFEFPMNGGEYCLGSVDGGTGAYLCYLDIGANAAKTQRTIFYETFTETIRTFEYPFGVAIVSASTVINSVVDPTDTANVVIKPAYYGALSITRVANEVTLVKATGMDNNAHPTLVEIDVGRIISNAIFMMAVIRQLI